MIRIVLGALVLLLTSTGAAHTRDWMARPMYVGSQGVASGSLQEMHRPVFLAGQLTFVGHATWADLPLAPGSTAIEAMGAEFEEATGLKWTLTKEKGFVRYSADWESQKRHMVIFVQKKRDRLRILTLHARSLWGKPLEEEALQMARARFTERVASNKNYWFISEANAADTPANPQQYWIRSPVAQPGIVVTSDCAGFPPRTDNLQTTIFPAEVSPQTKNSAKTLGILSMNFVHDLQASVLLQVMGNAIPKQSLTLDNFKTAFARIKDADESLQNLENTILTLLDRVNHNGSVSRLDAELDKASRSLPPHRDLCDFEKDLDSQIHEIRAAVVSPDKTALCEKIKDLVQKYSEADQTLKAAKEQIARNATAYFATLEREYGKANVRDVREKVDAAQRELISVRLSNLPLANTPEENCDAGQRTPRDPKKVASRAERERGQVRADKINQVAREIGDGWNSLIDSLCLRPGDKACTRRFEVPQCGTQVTQAPQFVANGPPTKLGPDARPQETAVAAAPPPASAISTLSGDGFVPRKTCHPDETLFYNKYFRDWFDIQICGFPYEVAPPGSGGSDGSGGGGGGHGGGKGGEHG